MVNKVFDVSAKFDTCRQVIVESGVTLPYLDLILGKSAYAHFQGPEVRLAYATVSLWALFRKVFISRLQGCGCGEGLALCTGCSRLPSRSPEQKRHPQPRLYVCLRLFGTPTAPWRAGVKTVP